MSKNLIHTLAWLLSFSVWAIGYRMLSHSAWWILLCAVAIVIAFIAVWMNESSPALDEQQS